jgi:hypothetical protein
MSTIGNVSGYDPSQIELLRQARAQEGAPEGSVRPGEMNAEEGANRIWSMLESRAEALGMDTEELSALQSEVKDAVLAVLESQDAGSSPEDSRQAVQDAILSTLAEHDIDTEKLKEDMAAHQGPPPGAGGPPGGSMPPEDEAVSDDATAQVAGSTNADLLGWLTQLFPLVDEEA